jgi:pimeloyl-ACP methyl ester carboxylesterase
VKDYGAPGPFSDAKMFSSVGPSGEYTLFRADASLGRDGFLHPIVVWGGGYTTTPDEYQATLTLIASHGFVIVACNDAQATSDCLSSGLDWLTAENSFPGAMRGKLDVSRALALGHSYGAGAVLAIADRMNIKAVASLQGIVVTSNNGSGNPNGNGNGSANTDIWAMQHAPLLLLAASGDALATPASVQSNFQASEVQTFFSTLNDSSAGQLYAIDESAPRCSASSTSMFGTCETAELEHAPVIAWFRLWACDDAAARRYFYGDTCALCTPPWTNPLRKHWK